MAETSTANGPAGAEIRIVLTRPLEEAQMVFAIERLLDESERARAAGFRRAEDRAAFVTGRALARTRLGRAVRCDPAALAFSATPAGKPTLDHIDAPHFNISHSGAVVALALSPRAVGVDVERIDRGRDLARLADAICTRVERERCARHIDPIRAFFEIWTAKEAVLKAQGMGLRIEPDRICVPAASPDWQPLSGAATDLRTLAGIEVACFDAGEGHAGAVAVMGGGLPVRLEWVDAHEILADA